MNKEILEKNVVDVKGVISSELRYSHEVFGEKFYTMHMISKRLSDFTDFIPLVISERLIDTRNNYIGRIIYISGQLRSYNRHEGDKNKLVLSVFVQELEILDDTKEEPHINDVFLDCYICKKPIYRKTPLGREITDLLVAVNRPYGKSDYIPCIAWGRNAKYADTLPVGTHLGIIGRFQSRSYIKVYDDKTAEMRTAYEVSVSQMRVLEKTEENR